MNPIEQIFVWPALVIGTSVPDTVLGFCQVLFVSALVPTVFGRDKPHIVTAAITAIGAGLTAWALFKSNLVFGATLTATCAVLWLSIFLQCCLLKIAGK